MFPFLARLRSESSLKSKLCLFIKKQLIFLELPFEAEVGADVGSCLPDEADGFLEPAALPFHEIGDDQRGRLYGRSVTLEMPAAQWTRMLPLASSRSTNSTNCEKYLEMFSDFMSRRG